MSRKHTKLERRNGKWFYHDMPITKHSWQLPAAHISYRLHITNNKYIEEDTLKDLRDAIYALEDDGEL